MKKQYLIVLLGVAVSATLIGAHAVSSGNRSVSPLENIDGIPFPSNSERGSVTITEKLAHADIYLEESVLAKQLELVVTFVPHNIQLLEVGVRENAFWLSYPKQILYQAAITQEQALFESPITKTVIIPLTDKLQDTNNSIDLMFFATSSSSTPSEDEGIADPTIWEVSHLSASVSPTVPTSIQLKNYLGSIAKREQAL